MLFNVSGLMQEGIGGTRRGTVQGTLTSEEHGAERLSGDIELLRTKDGVLVRAHLKLVDPENCSRCLKPLEETLPIDFEEEFKATVDLRSGQPVREAPDPDAFTIDEHHMLDLTEAVRQYREASAEMQPLCKPDCRGLCPNCGQDWNAGECDCNSGPIDSRWADLARLLDGEEDQRDNAPSGESGARGSRNSSRRSRPNVA